MWKNIFILIYIAAIMICILLRFKQLILFDNRWSDMTYCNLPRFYSTIVYGGIMLKLTIIFF